MTFRKKLLVILQTAISVGILVYWILYSQEIQEDTNLRNYEISFPIADIFFFCIIPSISTVLILLKKEIWYAFTLICSASLIYLGVVDMTHYIAVGIYNLTNLYMLIPQSASFIGGGLLAYAGLSNFREIRLERDRLLAERNACRDEEKKG